MADEIMLSAIAILPAATTSSMSVLLAEVSAKISAVIFFSSGGVDFLAACGLAQLRPQFASSLVLLPSEAYFESILILAVAPPCPGYHVRKHLIFRRYTAHFMRCKQRYTCTFSPLSIQHGFSEGWHYSYRHRNFSHCLACLLRPRTGSMCSGCWI